MLFLLAYVFLLISPTVQSNKNCIKPGCDSCISGFSYKNTSCLSICPSSFSQNSKTCEPSSSLSLFELEFFNFLNFSASSIDSFHHPLNLPFSEESKKGPLPTKTQGFYFESTSSLVSIKSWTLSPDFCFTLFFKSFKPGKIFTISENSSIFLEILSKDSKVEIFLNISKNDSFSLQKTEFSSSRFWTIFTFKCIQSKLHLMLWNNYENIPLISSEFQMSSNSSSFLLGAFENPSSNSENSENFQNSQSFQGFLYYFCMRNDLNCYYKTLSAPSCDLFNYVDLSCKPCDLKCGTWPFCTRETCNVCYSSSCLECSGYGSEHCSLCEDNSLDQCIKARNCAKGSGFKCEECLQTFELVEGLCLRPYSKFLPLNVKFDRIQQFVGGVFQSGANASTFAPFNLPEKDDPVPMKQRGYFFNAGTFMMTKNLNLQHKFSIFTWISVNNYVNVIQTELFSLFFDGIARIRLRNFEEFRLFIVNNDCVMEDWKALGVILDYREGTSYLHAVCNSRVMLKVQAKGYAFYDFNNYFNITASNFFFLYQLVILPFVDFEYWKILDICQKPFDASCLWRPDTTVYFNEGFQEYDKCDITCKAGCGSFATCNQCKYIDCSVCGSFEEKCQNGQKVDFCLNGLKISEDREKCCDFRCENCYGDRHFYCFSCRQGFYLDGNVCMAWCPTEFLIIGKKCEPPKDFIVFSILFNKKGKRLKSKSVIFDVGNSSAVLSKGRGLFFSQAKLNSSEFLMSSGFSLMLWVRVNKHGKILQKGDFLIDSNVFVEFSNHSLKFPPVILNTWTLMVFNFFELNGAYHVVLKSLFGLISTSLLKRTCFEDVQSSMVLGSDDFAGFIWKVSMFSKNDLNGTYFDVCSERVHENCLWDCDFLEYFDGKNCKPCHERCEFGCARQNDCNVCSDPYCSDCVSLDGKCECSDGYFWNGEKCQECDGVCTICKKGKCLKCAEGHKLVNDSCICEEINGKCIKCDLNCLECTGNSKNCSTLKTSSNLQTPASPFAQNKSFIVICSDLYSFTLLSPFFPSPNFLSPSPSSLPSLKYYLTFSPSFCDYFSNQSSLNLSDYLKNPENFLNFLQNSKKNPSNSLKLSKSDFEFLQIIGRGSYGEVWEVQHKKTLKTFALKLIPKSRLSNPSRILSSRRERDLLMRMFNKFIVNLHFSFQDDFFLYLVMDLMKGGSLRFHMLNSRLLTEEEAKFIICSVLLGLDYVHRQDIIHQDIKPDNILFNLKGEVFITDFGLSIPLSLSNEILSAGGTSGYISPEIAFKKNRTFTSDYFSVGVILYELIFEKRPFRGRSSEYYLNLKTVNPKNLEAHKNWTFEAVDFCYRLLEKNNSLRLGSQGFEQVKGHPWVRKFSWDLMEKGKIIPLFVPVEKMNFDMEDMSVWNDDRGEVDSDMMVQVFQDFSFERE